MKNAFKSVVLLTMFIFSMASCTHDNDPLYVDDGVSEGPGYSTDTLFVNRFAEPIQFDGIIDEAWSDAMPLRSTAKVPEAGYREITLNGSSNGNLELELFGLMSLAAIVLSRVDNLHYLKRIEDILDVAVEEVLATFFSFSSPPLSSLI